MIFYISSQVYQQTISTTIKEQDIFVIDSMIERNMEFYKYIKGNINILSPNTDIFLFDLSAFADLDDDILKAVRMLRTLYDHKRIIILAPNRMPGDQLLSNIFSLGILNIIASSDYLVIKEQLITCLSKDGKSFKDALEFKDVREYAEVVGRERLKVVSRVLIGMAGGQSRIGVTHNSIRLANFLRKRGFLVALVERNHSGDIARIQIGHGEKLHGNYFTMQGIDYYPELFDKGQLKEIMEKNYNFIIYDFGVLSTCDKEEFLKCHKKIILLGGKTWEIHYFNRIIKEFPTDALKQFSLCFNLVEESYQKFLKKGLKYPDGEIITTYFFEYHSDPFIVDVFKVAEELLEEYMLIPKKAEKKTIFSFKKRGGRTKNA